MAAYGSSNEGSATNGSLVITKPTSLAAGDMLVAFLSQRQSPGSWTLPSGWTQLAAIETPDNLDIRCFAKIADSDDAAATNFTFTYNASQDCQGILYRITGTFASTANIYAISAVAASEVATDILRAPTGITPYAANSLLIMYLYANSEDGASNAFADYAIENDNPTWTERHDFHVIAGDDETRRGSATATRAAVTPTGYFQAGVGSANLDPNGHVGILLAINDTTNASPTMDVVTASLTIPTITPTADANVSAPDVITLTASVPSVTPSTGQPLWTNTDKPSPGSITNVDKP
jgi:hypothetical protein